MKAQNTLWILGLNPNKKISNTDSVLGGNFKFIKTIMIKELDDRNCCISSSWQVSFEE